MLARFFCLSRVVPLRKVRHLTYLLLALTGAASLTDMADATTVQSYRVSGNSVFEEWYQPDDCGYFDTQVTAVSQPSGNFNYATVNISIINWCTNTYNYWYGSTSTDYLLTVQGASGATLTATIPVQIYATGIQSNGTVILNLSWSATSRPEVSQMLEHTNSPAGNTILRTSGNSSLATATGTITSNGSSLLPTNPLTQVGWFGTNMQGQLTVTHP